MFNFVVRHLGFLKVVPLLPYLFDSQLKLWLLITNPEILDCLDDIEVEVLTWDAVYTSLHKYGGLQFNCHNKEIGHMHSNGILDIRFNRKVKQQLMQQGRINNHHVFKNSGWTSFHLKSKQDTTYAVGLLKMAYARINENPFIK